MEYKLFNLTILTTLFGLFICAYGISVPNRRSFLSSQESNRWRGWRRSIDLDSFPGPPAQVLPSDAFQWTAMHETCHSKEITQNVTEAGCETKSIRNRMCYGVCAGIYIPAGPGSNEIKLCNQCQPAGPTSSITVTLKCAGGKSRTVTVATVERCLCSPCNPSHG